MSLSIVVPTLNEVDFLKETLIHLLEMAYEPDQLEVIVIDSGSTDDTLESIKSLPCTTFTRTDFIHKKYASLNFGLSKSNGDIVMFLDADTLLPQNFDQLIKAVLSKSNVAGGAFEFEFLSRNFSLWVVQIVNRLRYRIEQSYYGDQSVFCRKEIAEKMGGIPEKALMESAYFCRELRKIGRLKLIKQTVETSSRRFTEHGIWKVLWFDTRMWIRFLLGMDVDRFGKRYWKNKI